MDNINSAWAGVQQRHFPGNPTLKDWTGAKPDSHGPSLPAFSSFERREERVEEVSCEHFKPLFKARADFPINMHPARAWLPPLSGGSEEQVPTEPFRTEVFTGWRIGGDVSDDDVCSEPDAVRPRARRAAADIGGEQDDKSGVPEACPPASPGGGGSCGFADRICQSTASLPLDRLTARTTSACLGMASHRPEPGGGRRGHN